MGKKLTQEEFIKKCKEKHGIGKFNYSKVKFIKMRLKICLICNKCGHMFEQIPYSHLSGKGCPKCAGNIRKTTKQFIEDAQKIHGQLFDYSMVDYKVSNKKIKIKCNKCGHIFDQFPYAHLNGAGCPKCANNIQYTLEQFIEKSIKIHSVGTFDYSKVNYINNRTPIRLKCNKCSYIFEQIPFNHLRGYGCPNCTGARKLTTEEIISKFCLKFGDLYNYSKVRYISAKTPVEIICKIHGSFWQIPNSHLRNRGCPKCSSYRSKGEVEMCNFIKSIYSGKILENTRKFIGRQELDVYLPDLKIAFEYNGEHWHELREKREPGYHKDKRKVCENKNIKLIEVWEKEWKDNNEFIKQLIKDEIKKAESNQ